MTYSSGDVYDVDTTKSEIGIPGIPASERDNLFTMIIRNLDPTLVVDIWTRGRTEIKHRIPPNYDGVVLENVAFDHISGGLLGQVTTAGTAQLNIILFSREGQKPAPQVQVNNEGIPFVPRSQEIEDEDERTVEKVTV